MHKFKIDDKLKVVNYGFLVYQPHSEPTPSFPVYSKDDEGASYDVIPSFIGIEGVVEKIESTKEGEYLYTLYTLGDATKFYEDQLEKV